MTINRLVTIWTMGYFPFTMGGKVHRPIRCDVVGGELHDLGEGYKGYLITSPRTGKTYVAESITGAIVGSTLEQVRDDIATADPGTMRKQIVDARETAQHASHLTANEFWGMLK